MVFALYKREIAIQFRARIDVLKGFVKNISIARNISRSNHVPAQDDPFFTVVIPIYNRTTEVRESIESVLLQSYKNFELLLICDGSPPETLEVVDEFAHHPQVRIIKFSENSGNPCRGRNKGIQIAKGKYFLFLDSDDIASSTRLERTLYHIIDKKVDIIGGAIEYLVEGDSSRNFSNGQLGYTGEKCNYEILKSGNCLSICTVAVRLDCLKEYGGFREQMRYREDHELWLRLAYRGCTFYNSPEVYAKYRIHHDNAELDYIEHDDYWLEKALELHVKEITKTE